MSSVISTSWNPVASASPSAWLLIPAFPSCSTQANGRSASSGIAGVARKGFNAVFGNSARVRGRSRSLGSAQLLSGHPLQRPQWRACRLGHDVDIKVECLFEHMLAGDGRMDDLIGKAQPARAGWKGDFLTRRALLVRGIPLGDVM